MLQRITKFTMLPPFPPTLVKHINAEEVYVNQKATMHMNEFLRDFILNVTEDLYPTITEYDLIKTKVISRLKVMGLTDVSFYEVRYSKLFVLFSLNDTAALHRSLSLTMFSFVLFRIGLSPH